MPVTLLGFTLQGFSLSKSWCPLRPVSSLAVEPPFRNLRTPSAFASAPPPSARPSASSPRPPTEQDPTLPIEPQGLSPRWNRDFNDPLPANKNSLTNETNPFSGAPSPSSLPCRSRPWRDFRQTASTPEFCSPRESVPLDASSSRSEQPMPSWVFSPL